MSQNLFLKLQAYFLCHQSFQRKDFNLKFSPWTSILIFGGLICFKYVLSMFRNRIDKKWPIVISYALKNPELQLVCDGTITVMLFCTGGHA